MGTRLELQTLLESIMADVLRANYEESAIQTEAHRRVYFQPPETVKMVYPCIVYTLEDISTRYADNSPYTHRKAYTVTIIDRDPDSLIPDRIGELPLCSFSRKFTNDNLNHFVFRLYF